MCLHHAVKGAITNVSVKCFLSFYDFPIKFSKFFVSVEMFVFVKTGYLVYITSFGCRDNETN